jgi:hypothetical protein
VFILRNACPWGWPYEWLKHVEGITAFVIHLHKLVCICSVSSPYLSVHCKVMHHLKLFVNYLVTSQWLIVWVSDWFLETLSGLWFLETLSELWFLEALSGLWFLETLPGLWFLETLSGLWFLETLPGLWFLETFAWIVISGNLVWIVTYIWSFIDRTPGIIKHPFHRQMQGSSSVHLYNKRRRGGSALRILSDLKYFKEPEVTAGKNFRKGTI